MECENLNKCPFYNEKMPMQKGIGSIYKNKFCKGNKQLCARYKVLTEAGEAYVSDFLYPNMHDIAQEIIDKAKQDK